MERSEAITRKHIIGSLMMCFVFFSAFVAKAEEVNHKQTMPAYLKSYVPSTSFYSFHIRKGNVVFLQINNDPATNAKNQHWPGGCASSRMINLQTSQSYYIYEPDGSYFCSNYHHDVVQTVDILSPLNILIGMGGGGRCALIRHAVWNPRRNRYVIVKTREVWCDPK